jgi:hypothetical protein
VLSTFIFFWNLSRSRPKIKVRLIYDAKEIGDELEGGICISVQNISAHTIHLSNISLLYRFEKTKLWENISHIIRFRRIPRTVGWVYTSLSNYGIEDGCPISLEARNSHEVFVPFKVLNKILEDALRRDIRAVVQDQLWQNTYSRRFNVKRIDV